MNDNLSSVKTYSETALFPIGNCLFKVNNNNNEAEMWCLKTFKFILGRFEKDIVT